MWKFESVEVYLGWCILAILMWGKKPKALQAKKAPQLDFNLSQKYYVIDWLVCLSNKKLWYL